ncbi:hypothetical protein ACHAQA_000132 [Verticillium albo-atrum]
MNQQFTSYDDLQRQLQAREQEVNALKAQLQLASQNHSQSSLASHPVHYPVQRGDFPVDFASVPRNVPVQQHAVPSARKVQRSKSTMGHTTSSMVSGRPMDRSNEPQHPVKRLRVMSQQFTPSPSMSTGMSRSGSNQSAKNVPFVAAGPIAPLQTSNTSNAAMDRFCQSRDDPSNAHVFATSLQRAPSIQRRSNLQSVEEHSPLVDVGIDPMTYLESYGADAFSSSNLIPPQPQNFPSFNTHRGSNSSLMMSACPSMTSGPSAAESIPLTRDSSSFDNSLTGAFDMARLDSMQSQQTDYSVEQDFFSSSQDASCNKNSNMVSYLGGSLTDPSSEDYSTSAPTDQFLSQESVSMERSNSATSSQSSVERRAREARLRHNMNAARPLAAKPEAVVKSSPSHTPKKDGKVAMAKTGSYTRPKHDKVFCDMCNDNPDGFRGEHELKRHNEAKHAGLVKKFICRDPALLGIHSNVKALHPLSKCKQCIAKKQYGAYYNAAAHLRRTHFKPKVARGKKTRAEDDEKRGGKGGGDWPSMNELKSWFEEVQVRIGDNNDATEENEEENEVADTNIAPMDMTFAGIGDNQDMDFSGYGMMPELPLDTTTSAEQSVFMSATAPLSSASTTFEFSPYNSQSPMNMMASEAAFSSISSPHAIAQGNYENSMTHGFADDFAPFPFDLPLA